MPGGTAGEVSEGIKQIRHRFPEILRFEHFELTHPKDCIALSTNCSADSRRWDLECRS
jgi:hypothetical protein